MARRRSPRVAAAVALALAVVVLGAIVLSSRGGDEDRAPRRAETTPTATPKSERTPRPEPREPAPARAVRGFYEAAANDEWDRAWSLLGPDFQAEFGSQQQMQAELDSLQSIRFRTLRVVERSGDRATVEVRTVATHTDRVDNCAGTLLVTRIGGAWRVDPLTIGC